MALHSSPPHSPSPADAAARAAKAERLRRGLEAYMAVHGLRSTDQRRLIVETFLTTTSHVSIEDLLALVKQTDSRIGYATVYRTLKLLAESGVALERQFGDGFTRYEMADEDVHHDHLICVDCGLILEFEEPAIERLQEEVAMRHGFQLAHHRHELYGRCDQCVLARAAASASGREST